MNNEINLRTLCTGVYDERAKTRKRSHDFCQTRPPTRRVVWCNTLWVGENSKIERGRLKLNLASLSIHGSVKYPVKSHQTLTMTVQSDVCDDSPAETATSDLSQLTTVLQRDIEGKSYLFSQCPPVLIPLLCSEI